MELRLKTTACLLLFVHMAALQQPTDSPGRGIDKGWLRELVQQAASLNTSVDEEGPSTMDSSSEVSNTSPPPPSSAANPEEEAFPGPGSTAEASTPPDAAASPTTTPVLADTGLKNATADGNSTATPPATADSPATNASRAPDLQSTTEAPQANATREPTTKLSNGTESNATTAEPNATSAAASSSTPLPFETTEASPSTTTSTAVNAPTTANKTAKDAALGGSSERGFASDPPRNRRYGEWAAVLGTMLAVTIAGLVAYVVLKSRRDKGFSHRKLVEEFPSDPVLRLDNSEPLDLNFSGSAYYNAGLQGDSIQMTNFPKRQ